MRTHRIRLFPLLLAAALAAAVSAPALAAGKGVPAFADATFDAPGDNLYLPMAIGLTYVYEAETDEGLARNEITATEDTVEILDVTCTVVHDVEWLVVEGVGTILLEDTRDWLAWDDYGNVWYFGEDTVAYLYDDAWNLVGTSTEGSWTAGVDGAEPGILMLAEPVPGISYYQEFYADVAEDQAKVLRLNAEVSVPYGDFDECLVTKEWTALEPGSVEHKYYAPGVGLVQVRELSGGKTVRVELDDIVVSPD